VQRAYLDAETKVVQLPLLEGSAPARLVVDDTHFLFTAHFKKSGADLILTGDDGKKLVITGYFNLEKHPDLVSPDGAIISADLVERLAGPDAPGQYAQAGAPAGALVIGRVEAVSGITTVQHANGVVDNLKNGDSLLKGDVVMTGDGDGCTLSLIDGTALNMGSNARMVLAELAYDSNSTSNSALINLVKGSFVFVAGQVAHTGDMKVSTPVATMGIRGTTVGTYLDADVNGNVYQLTATLLSDPGGGSGAYDVMDPVTGAVLQRVRSTATQVTLTYGANNQLSMQESAKSPAIIQHELAVAQILFPIFLANPNNVQLNQTTPQVPNNSLSPPQQQPQPPQETDSNAAVHFNLVIAGPTTAPVTNVATATLNNNIVLTPITQTNAPQSSTFNATLTFTDTSIGRADAAAVQFTVGGLNNGGNGTITFSDGNHANDIVVQIVNGLPVNPSVNLSRMTDGPITATLLVTDPSGNTFHATASAQLDQDLNEHPTVAFSQTNVARANAAAVAFVVLGLETDDNGTITFSDGTHDVKVNVVNGVPVSQTVNLSGMSSGVITATLSTIDPSGNQFLANASTQLGGGPAITFGEAIIGSANAASVVMTVSGVPVGENGTITFSDGNPAHDFVVGIINFGPTDLTITFTEDFSRFSDGVITATLSLTDPSGNQFHTTASVELDQDLNENPTIAFAQSNLDHATAASVAFAVSGLEPDDNGAIIFSDGNHAHDVTVNIVNGVTVSQTVNLSGLTDGPITASLSASDPAGNHFHATATAQLDQDSDSAIAAASAVAAASVSEDSSTILSGTTLTLTGASAEAVTFANDHGNSGTLVLDHSAAFTGQISGFAGDGTLSHSDSIDLQDIGFATAKEAYAGGTLTVTDDVHTANLHFNGDYVLANFILASDDHGGTLVIDPPAPFDLADRFHVDNPDAGLQETHGLAHENAPSGTLATADATHDQFHFGDMDLIGLNARASGLAPALSGFGSDHFQFAAMDIDGFHQAPIAAHPLELDLRQAPLQEIVEAAAPPVHEVTPVTAEVSPVASMFDVIHAIHAHTA
jgi:FecR protein